jgi:PhnB protein
MAERPLADRLDESVDAILTRGDATGALRDRELAPLARVAADLRHYPSPDFKARLRAQLERQTEQLERTPTMTAVSTTPAVREGFTTVTPYIRVGQEGLADFLVQVFDAQETFSGRGGGGGMHREIRIGDSMLMIGEGGSSASAVMPIRPVAFHVFVKDVDATFERAVAAGAEPIGKPEDRHYGERSGFVRDPFGNHWYIATALGPKSLANALRTVTPALHVQRPVEYVDFLTRGLGAVDEMSALGPAGELRYGLVRVGDAAIELSGEGTPMPGSFMLYVADPDTLYQQAIAAGATSIMPLTDQPHGRVGGVQDMEGSQWFFSRPVTAS